MTEYKITIQIFVDAKDEDQALDIANDLRRAVEHTKPWKLNDVEVTRVEEA